MLFEIYNKEGQRMEYTQSIGCIIDSYEKGNLQSMNSIGWKFKLDGIIVSLNKLVNTLQLNARCRITSTTVKPIDKPIVSNDSKPKRKVRKIRCLNNNTTYNNMSACAKDLGIDPAAISYVMQKGTNEYKEYKFEFVED